MFLAVSRAPCPQCYKLHSTCSYTRGNAYFLEWTSQSKHALREWLVLTRILPNTRPLPPVSESVSVQVIPGMIQLVPGMPFVQVVNGEPMTIACLHTTASLCHYHGVRQQVQELTKTLCDLTFSVIREGEVTMDPVYTLPGLKWNNRSARVPVGSHDGSYNLASTVLKGGGQGCFLPAVQTSTAEAQKRIKDITITLHQLGRIVLRHSISKFKWELFEFICMVNNVVGFGGFEPNGTGLQMNISSGFNSLADLIGQHQGGYHSDQGDEHMLWTTLTLLFRLPKGTSHPPFPFWANRTASQELTMAHSSLRALAFMSGR